MDWHWRWCEKFLPLGSSIPLVCSLTDQTGRRSGAGGVCWDFFREPLSAWDPRLLSLAHGCRGQGCLAEGWAVRFSLKRLRPKWGFRAEPYVAFQREIKLHKSHITSRGFFHPVISKQCRAFPEGVMYRNQDSCITPANTTAALWLVWELPRASSGFKKGKNMLEKVVFHLFLWGRSPLDLEPTALPMRASLVASCAMGAGCWPPSLGGCRGAAPPCP